MEVLIVGFNPETETKKSIIIPNNLLQKIEEMRIAERRSFNQQVIYLLEKQILENSTDKK